MRGTPWTEGWEGEQIGEQRRWKRIQLMEMRNNIQMQLFNALNEAGSALQSCSVHAVLNSSHVLTEQNIPIGIPYRELLRHKTSDVHTHGIEWNTDCSTPHATLFSQEIFLTKVLPCDG
jgi:hypothetical protein